MDLMTKKLILSKTLGKNKLQKTDSKNDISYNQKKNIEAQKVIPKQISTPEKSKYFIDKISEETLLSSKLLKKSDSKLFSISNKSIFKVNRLATEDSKLKPSITVNNFKRIDKITEDSIPKFIEDSNKTATIQSQKSYKHNRILSLNINTNESIKDVSTKSTFNSTFRSNYKKDNSKLFHSQTKFNLFKDIDKKNTILTPSESLANLQQNSISRIMSSERKTEFNNEYGTITDSLHKYTKSNDSKAQPMQNFSKNNSLLSNLSELNSNINLPVVESKFAKNRSSSIKSPSLKPANRRSSSIPSVLPIKKKKKYNVFKIFRRNAYGFTTNLLKLNRLEDNNYSKTKKSMKINNNDLMNNQHLDKESRKMMVKLDEQLQLNKGSYVPSIKTGTALNRYIIRDFLIGETTDAVNSSKKKMKLTTDFLKEKEEKQKKRLEILGERFEKMKNVSDRIIEEDIEIPDADSILLPQSINFHGKDIYREFENNNMFYDKRMKDEIDENSKKLADMILEIDCSDYESIDSDEDNFLRKNVYKKNIDRIVRLRKILKSRNDPDNDNFGFGDLNQFKEQRRENDNELIRTLNRLGPPNFLKTKFKKGTIEKYKIVNGKFFGVIV